MIELENLKKERFILECKDHWNAKDWDYAMELDRKISLLTPQKKAEPVQKEIKWPRYFVGTSPEGIKAGYVCNWVKVNSYEDAARYAQENGIKFWDTIEDN